MIGDALLARVRLAVDPLLQAQAEELAAAARDRAPVRTGKYKASIQVVQVATSDLNLIAYTVQTVKYARFIFSGKVGKVAQGRIRPVLTRDLGDPFRAGARERARQILATVRAAASAGPVT